MHRSKIPIELSIENVDKKKITILNSVFIILNILRYIYSYISPELCTYVPKKIFFKNN